MAAGTDVIQGGFADPVFEAQRTFRAVMDAVANPGRIVPLSTSCNPPAPLGKTTGAVAATLLDHDTRVWLDRPLQADDAVAGWLRFQTGTVVTNEAAEADFALVSDPGQLIMLDHFSRGTAEYPDRSTTLILQVDGFEDGDALTLAGPGIDGERVFSPTPRLPRFTEQWRANRAVFPRGVDLIFAGTDLVAAMPRSTRILDMEG